ncbi:MAG: hypothetical protein LBD53_02865, partial [Tannerella sp.]|nr:hypothetical protein [Tannerella sp.]
EFEIKHIDYEAFYDMNANLLMMEHEISVRELPAVVKNAAESRHPKFRFEDLDKIIRGSETLYRIEMELNDFDVKMLIRSDGTVVSDIDDN